MKIKKIPIEKINPSIYNPRLDIKPGDHEYESLKRSITEFGFVDPLVWNEHNGNLIGGHQRYKILLELGYKEIDVSVVNIKDPKMEMALNVSLNKNLGDWDYAKLKELLVNLDDGAFDLTLTGFDEAELKKLIDWDGGQGLTNEDDVPELPKKAKSKMGEIYQLSNHRLMCGDAAIKDDVKRLMNGEKADMVFTDPPYGVDYGKKNRLLNSFQKAGRNLKDIANDTLGKDELFDFLVKAFTLAFDFGKDYCSYYITAPQGGELGLTMMMMMMSGLPVRHVLIWNKNRQNFSLGRLDYEYKHEPILFTWKKTHKFYGKGTHKNSVWDIDKELKCDIRPTMKPVELIENAVLNSSKKDDVVADFFLGSGSTIIACEKTNRRCYGLEIEPIYVDVAVKRWEDFTGKKAVKIK